MSDSERAELIRRAREVWRSATRLERELADALEASEAEKAKFIEAVRLECDWAVRPDGFISVEKLREACDEAEAPS